MGQNDKIVGVLMMAATASLWSMAGLFIKVIDWNPFAIAGVRSFIASLVILAFLRKPKIHWSFPQVAAAVANAVTMLLFVVANKTTTAANAILLQYMAPVFTAFIGAALLKEKTRIEHWVSIFFVAVGMTIMFANKLDGGQLFGDAIALTSAVTFSLYIVFMRMQKEGSPLESNLLSQWIAAGVCLIDISVSAHAAIHAEICCGHTGARHRSDRNPLDPDSLCNQADLCGIGKPHCSDRTCAESGMGLPCSRRISRHEYDHRRCRHPVCSDRGFNDQRAEKHDIRYDHTSPAIAPKYAACSGMWDRWPC